MRLIFAGQFQSHPAIVLTTEKRASWIRRCTLRSWRWATFTGDKFLKVVEMAVTVASGLLGGRHSIFEQIAQTKAAQVVLQTGVCRRH
jgi:hypothetical protein